MRFFDVVGGSILIVWLVLIANIGWQEYRPKHLVSADGKLAEIALEEGESWMLLVRGNKEIGYIHETRTDLDQDWLFEYTLFINMNPIGSVKSDIKSTMSKNGIIRNVRTITKVGPKEISLEAEVEGSEVKITSSMQEMNRTIQLKKAPKLSTHVYRTLATLKDLKPGSIYKEKFFDALSLGMSEMVFEFVEFKDVDLYGEKIPARHFIQKIAGNALDVYVDKEGGVLIQEFPFQIVASRVAPSFGRSRARAMRVAKKGDREGVELELGQAFFGASGESSYVISGIQESENLPLSSFSQKLIRWTDEGAIVDTNSMESIKNISSEEEEEALKATPRIDYQHEVFNFAAISSDKNVLPIALHIVKQVSEKMKIVPVKTPLPASAIYARGEGDCTEFSIVTLAALRRSGLPSRFVYGVKADKDGKFVAHQWVEFWEGQRFYEVDATEKDGKVTTNTIRFFSSNDPESPRFLDLLGRVKIQPYHSSKSGQTADFN